MPVAAALPWITTSTVTAGAVVAGTGYSIYQGQQVNKYNKRTETTQRQMNDLAQARAKRDAIRSARAAAATARSNSENQNVAMSSGAEGGVSSIQSQLSYNLSFLDQYQTLADQASISLGKAQGAEYKMGLGDQVASLGMFGFANRDRLADGIKKVFKSG